LYIVTNFLQIRHGAHNQGITLIEIIFIFPWRPEIKNFTLARRVTEPELLLLLSRKTRLLLLLIGSPLLFVLLSTTISA
jgi:hypothetical protein